MSNNLTNTFIVQKLLAKRIINNTLHYKVQWSDNHTPTWEPHYNFINCETLFKSFSQGKKLTLPTNKGDILYDIPFKIISRSIENDTKNDISFLIEWKSRDNGIKPLNSPVLRTVLKQKYPKILIDYYEKHLIFN